VERGGVGEDGYRKERRGEKGLKGERESKDTTVDLPSLTPDASGVSLLPQHSISHSHIFYTTFSCLGRIIRCLGTLSRQRPNI